MASDMVPKSPNNDLLKLTDAQLKAELVTCLKFQAENAFRLAILYVELQRRGHDLSDLKIWGRTWLYPIATGQLLVEAVVAFMDRACAVNALIGVPLELQRKIVDGYKLKVYNPGGGKPSSMTLAEMPPHLIRLVFQDGKILGLDKQKARLRHAPAHKSISATKRLLRTRILVNKDKGIISVGPSKADTYAVVEAMAAAGGANQEVIETPERRACVLATKVTDEEKERMEALAIAKGTTVDALVRKAVIAMYLLH